MFSYDLFDQKITEHARRVRQINCFGWMREGLDRGLGRRFGRRKQRSAGDDRSAR